MPKVGGGLAKPARVLGTNRLQLMCYWIQFLEFLRLFLHRHAVGFSTQSYSANHMHAADKLVFFHYTFGSKEPQRRLFKGTACLSVS